MHFARSVLRLQPFFPSFLLHLLPRWILLIVHVSHYPLAFQHSRFGRRPSNRPFRIPTIRYCACVNVTGNWLSTSLQRPTSGITTTLLATPSLFDIDTTLLGRRSSKHTT
ncbi:hypothetical protein BKA66DRAFT_293900 [Pyrenochaeta sp. MPI-SDFR-AT-0127]|nr:hypothetical protein BKA66DRAFT_293900 [Pyrenochaeta sp. MPI-SDFR-AT-0127]